MTKQVVPESITLACLRALERYKKLYFRREVQTKEEIAGRHRAAVRSLVDNIERLYQGDDDGC